MKHEKIHKSSSRKSATQEGSISQLALRPNNIQAKQNSQKPPTQEEIENEAFNQDKQEAFGLQLKEKYGAIAPEEQARLGLLQAKMDDFWVQRWEKRSHLGHNFANIPIHAPDKQVSAPIQPHLPPFQAKLTIGEPGDKYEQEADRVASQVVEQINTRSAAQSTQGQSVQRQEEPEDESSPVPVKQEVTSIQQLQAVVEKLKGEKNWGGDNYGSQWQCNDISDLLCESVQGCTRESTSGYTLVRGGVIPGGQREGNTISHGTEAFWYFESYHAYVNVENIGRYDPTFNRSVSDGDIVVGDKKYSDESRVEFEYYKFPGEKYGTPDESGTLHIYNSYLELSTAVDDPSTEVGKFWGDDESSVADASDVGQG
ncbi:hypothetical protein H6G33_14765 [Calothrix sp. FACHB-1219]|uniref:hypothetical protein n=1 Tax=unclassified Calothrix TaxID=2619626 RepID=UPI001682CE19|nr:MULTISPECIES: hypothetical protein [unclassified Calothrix]MBD2203918.1 hypothetical protein [Calothrix sp. FACHB-168]MBD2218297.1 hypothetical protein [Calothrix sp. FACHB-1219]